MEDRKEQLKVVNSKGLSKLFEENKISILISTYQAGKVMIVSGENGKLTQIAKSFKRPMGIAINGDQLAVACLNEVRVFKNAPKLAGNFPKRPNFYDTMYMPRGVYFSGTTDVHDLVFGNGKLWAVNTLFSCICNIDHQNSFTPWWQPWFIDELTPEDRCHLNGMDLIDGQPAIVSALGMHNEREGWRKSLVDGGVILDVMNNKVLVEGLGMPHSPRIFGKELYFLQSALGVLTMYNLETGNVRNVDLPGFPRGMAEYDGMLFIGLSKIRKSSKTFSQLPVKERATHAGMVVVDIKSGFILGEMRYENLIDEIYDVQVLPNYTRPGIINPEDEVHNLAIAAEPDLYYWRVKKKPTTDDSHVKTEA